ncbi:hypothetical protein NEUTE1DRAFT_46743 [Neurospora tetrasperma FGSC 2508]|uniref:Uncharacterized protein n=1 Tax=Neurospora tetrasperma (strain FGSC 2508 / ATCC MYA-4615 / P0657) TaxID=510951 RepID=F8MT52_NEUT8|nr:uncharacterized protein NEUTE1DRAFT_46743 [Neurospora tetrasperma FGSC 2508]EGO55184.1 hypothetical protein NEUTE1DRAFT_46743 [Neurospora tetrasperma FGSC 2508]EGZ69600.1 hypothetical protein NEUTE2DRAFT_70495 [Neurospora tetrasperma FGSC 2509]
MTKSLLQSLLTTQFSVSLSCHQPSLLEIPSNPPFSTTVQSYTEDHLYTPNEREALARHLIADSNIDSYEKYEEVMFALHGYINPLRKTYWKRKARDAEELFTIQRRERLAIELLGFIKGMMSLGYVLCGCGEAADISGWMPLLMTMRSVKATFYVPAPTGKNRICTFVVDRLTAEACE